MPGRAALGHRLAMAARRAAIADLWADARPRPFRGAPAHALGPEWELLYLAVHAARHRWESLKWLVDIHEVCRRDGLDWEKVRAKADRFGLTDVLEISLRASAALFDTPLPSSLPARALPGWLDALPGHARSARHLAGRALPRAPLLPALGEAPLSRRRAPRADAGRAAADPAARPLSGRSTIRCARCAWRAGGGSTRARAARIA